MPNFPSLVNTVSSSDRYGYEGLPPELAAEEQAVNRRQQMAQYLMQQGMQPTQGQMVGRFYVPASPLQGLAGLAQVGVGAYGQSQADAARKGISGKSQAMLADAMQQYKEASSPVTSEGPRPTAQIMPPPRPGVGLAPQPPQEPQTVALQGPGAPVTTPRTPEEKRQAMVELMLNSHPRAAKTGAMLLQQDQADREHGLQREFLGEQKEKDRQNRIDTTQAQQGQAIVMATLLGANKKDLEELQARHDKEIERIRGEYKTGTAKIAADAKTSPGKPMSAIAQKELIQTDEQIQGGQAAITALQQAMKINDEALGFTGAGALASAGSLLPDAIRPKAVDATVELDNIIMSSALPQLKEIFGGMPTEGERKVLLEMQGSSSKTPEVRKEIFARAQQAIERRIAFNQEKAMKLRQGSYFSEEGTPTVTPDTMKPSTPGSDGKAGWGIKKKS